jgi:FtsH-binding integral membrane protein
MGAGVATSMGVSLAFAPLASMSSAAPFVLFGTGACLAFGGVYGISTIDPEYQKVSFTPSSSFGESSSQSVEIMIAKDKPLREVSFGALTVGMGLIMGPVISIYIDSDPMVIPISLLASSAVFGGCAFASSRIKETTLMTWKAPLSIGLGSLVGLQLLGIGGSLIFGANSFSEAIHSVDLVGGIGLFTMMSIYDAYAARKMYLEGDPDHIGCSTMVYLDFMNLLIRLMEVLSKIRKD